MVMNNSPLSPNLSDVSQTIKTILELFENNASNQQIYAAINSAASEYKQRLIVQTNSKVGQAELIATYTAHQQLITQFSKWVENTLGRASLDRLKIKGRRVPTKYYVHRWLDDETFVCIGPLLTRAEVSAARNRTVKRDSKKILHMWTINEVKPMIARFD